MKIVILDSETVSRNDVSLEGITVLGESIVYGFTPNEQVAEKIGDADAVICNKCLITEEVFSKCKNLKYVGLCLLNTTPRPRDRTRYRKPSSD